MKIIIIYFFLLIQIAYPSFEFDYQLFDSYRSKSGTAPFLAADSIFIGYDFRSPNESMSTFIKMYINIDAIYKEHKNVLLSIFFKDYAIDHNEPMAMLGGGMRYRHKLFSEWHLDSEIGIYECSVSSFSIITPMLSIGIYNQFKKEAWRIYYIPYRKEFGSIVTDHYMLTASFKF